MMLAVAAVAAGAAFAGSEGVQSSNIVGYNTVNAGVDEPSKAMGCGFVSVGQTGSWTLGQVKVTEDFEPGTDFIQFLNEDDASCAQAVSFDGEAWIDTDSGDDVTDYVQEQGKAFLLYIDSGIAQAFTFEGEVPSGKVEIPTGAALSPFFGNPFPCDITYAKLGVEGSFEPGTDFIQVLNPIDASCAQAISFDGEAWIDTDSGDDMTEEAINAGAAFLGYIDSGADDIVFTFEALNL